MASRRDQLQSYQFLTHRVISALVMRETDPAESPLRRGVGAVFAGLMISMIIAAGFGVVGLLTKVGNSRWQVDGAVVVEKETGAVYLYQGQVLHPMANYASALLASGHIPPSTTSVSRNSLVRVPRGNTLGILNAPSALPDEGKRVGAPWTVCAVPGTDSAGNASVATVLLVSLAPQQARRVPDDQGLVVRIVKRQSYYLVYHGYKYPIRQPDNVLTSLYGSNPPIAVVQSAWLNAIPEGKPIEPISVPKAGAASTAVPGRHVGDLLAAPLPSGLQYYLVFDEGLAAVTELQKDIYVGQTGVQPISIAVRDATSAKKANRLAPVDGDEQPPSAPPKLVQPASADDPVCTQASDAHDRATIWIGGTMPELAGTPTTLSSSSGTMYADRVVVPPGQVAIVRVLPSPTAASGSYSVITDVGVRYPVVSVEALAMLGYRAGKAVDVPANVMRLIPAGPTLDPADASQPVDLTAPAVSATGRR